MKSWKDVEVYADENGHIPETIYNESQFQNDEKPSHRRRPVSRKELKILDSGFRRNDNKRPFKLAQLIEKGLLKKEMVSIRKWNFRRPSPVACRTQDFTVFSLTGNYATMEEQPFILHEIVKYIKDGGYFIARFINFMDFTDEGEIAVLHPQACNFYHPAMIAIRKQISQFIDFHLKV